MAKMDLIKTPKMCQNMINRYLKDNHEIPEVYFPFVRSQIINGGILANSWGRQLDFDGYMINHNIYRKGYSFYLQSENTDLLNQKGFKPLHNLIEKEKLGSRVNMLVHDDLVVSCPFEEAYFIAKFLVESLEERRMIMGNWLSVPACTSIGFSYDSSDSFEWKDLPEQKIFDEKVRELHDNS
jgi:DNA polymerase I-like protein with 3'-5' exonuclease and polymerase domains